MQGWFANLQSIFPVLFGGTILWILFGIGISILYRRLKGKPIFPQKPDQSLFFESSGSGHSNRSLITRLGGARNCLHVAVTKDSLIVQPKFPFNLMFLPEIYGLEYSIPRKQITSVVEKDGFLSKSVTVEFSTANSEHQSIVLNMRRMDEFIAALAAK